MGRAFPQRPDVCIVGSGPAGLAVAWSLGKAGRTVLLLESGGSRPSARARELNEGDHVGVAYNGLTQTRHRQIGGTPNIWNVGLGAEIGAKFVPLDASDLDRWPLQWSDLEPDYVEAQALCGLGVFDYSAESRSAVECRPFELRGTDLTNGIYRFASMRRFTRDLVAEVLALENVALLSQTTVVRLDVDDVDGGLTSVQAADAHGRRTVLLPRATVLACGAVENARLLLLAGLDRTARLSWLGRGFMEHARDLALLVPDDRAIFDRAAFYDCRPSADGTLIGGRIALATGIPRQLDLPNASLTVIPRPAARDGPRWAAVRRALGAGAPPKRYGWSERRGGAERFDAFDVVVNLEQQPEFSNRITLSERRDRFGNELPRLELRWSPTEQHRLDRLRALLVESFKAAGIGTLHTGTGPPDLNAHHHSGTTRMGTDVDDGVVDRACRVFGLDNLFVAGASTFPSAGYANPTLTVVALALRLGREINRALGS